MAANPKAVALGGVAAAAAVAALLAVRGPDGKSVEIPFDHQPDPAKAKCVKVNVYADAECMEQLGLSPDAAKDGTRSGDYLRIEACGDGDELPSCVIPVNPTAEEVPFQAGKKQLRAKRSGVDDESPCACSTGANCEYEVTAMNGVKSWQPAPKALTLTTWRGAGCRRKTCVELAGRSSMPAVCAVP